MKNTDNTISNPSAETTSAAAGTQVPAYKHVTSKVAKKSYVDVILNYQRTLYKKQVDKSINTKKLTLQEALNKRCDGVYTVDVFYMDIATRIDMLVSNARFAEDCVKYGLDIFSAATHFVLLGHQALSDYLLQRPGRNGQGGVLRPFCEEWNTPLFNQASMERDVPHIAIMLNLWKKDQLAA